VLAPANPLDQQNERAPAAVAGSGQQPSRTMPPPVLVTQPAADPAVPIAVRHFRRR